MDTKPPPPPSVFVSDKLPRLTILKSAFVEVEDHTCENESWSVYVCGARKKSSIFTGGQTTLTTTTITYQNLQLSVVE